MTEIEVDCGHGWLADQCAKHIGPRKFYLHNRIGGEGWDVRPAKIHVNGVDKRGTRARIDDPMMATFLLLKIK